jgi:isopenicillin-N epimerase
VAIPACDIPELKIRLYDEYSIEVPVMNWHDNYFMRVSIQAYTTQANIDALLGAIQEIFS